MTVHHYLAEGLESGALVEVPPLYPTMVVRRIFMTEDVARLLRGPWESPDLELSDSEWEYRCGFVRRQFDRFINGKRVGVALDPQSDAENCFFKRIHPIEDEVWEIRCRVPPPGVRVFGRFAETDIFVAMHWRLRKDMGYWGDPSWDHAIEVCRGFWGTLFASTNPKSGNTNDYVRNAFPV